MRCVVPAIQALQNTASVWVAGFAFDEMVPGVVIQGLQIARKAGAAIFFDPGWFKGQIEHVMCSRRLH